MQIEAGRTRLSFTFPFAAVVTLMFIFCDTEIVAVSLLSSLLHEGGHLFFMLLFRDAPLLICFGAFGVRIERAGNISPDLKKEALIALGGIFGNLFLALSATVFYLLFKSEWAIKTVVVNAFIAFFNMLPVRFFDAGRFLECMLALALEEEKSEKILRVISFAVSVAVFLFCVFYNIFIGINVSLIAVCVYIILITTLKE